MGPVRLFHPLQGDRALASPLRLGEGKGDRRLVALGRFDALHTRKLLDAVLCLRRLAGFCAETVDEALQFRDLPLLVLVGSPLLLLPGGLLGEVLVVVAPVAVELPVADLEDPQADGVEELPVVRNRQDRPSVLGEMVLEPSERLQIQMVRRFVEHQDIGLHDEESRQVSPHDPAAA